MGSHAGDFGAVTPQGHDDGTGSTTALGRRPHSDETALLGDLDPAGTDEDLPHVLPEAYCDATDPWGRGEGARRVEAASEAERAPAIAHVEHINIDRIVSGAAAAPDVPPLPAEPFQERDVLTHSR